jgi:AraC family transcriptional regulator of adaptative response/methylated-DNA-[protein]-cysteine methyltransferase
MSLAELARIADCSARQVQRDFAHIGVTPSAYGRAVRTGRARAALRQSDSVIDALHGTGYGSVRGFYEEAGRRLGMTPSQYAAGGVDLPLIWAVTPSAVGLVIAVASPDGLCAVRIGASRSELVHEVTEEFNASRLREDPAAMVDVLRALRALALGERAADLPINVRGTAFQARVWSALREIPPGQTRTYAQVADAIDAPSSVRAVASACAQNRVALAIPCHRVIRSDGSLAGYRWGLEVKEQLLEAERSTAPWHKFGHGQDPRTRDEPRT